MIITNEKQIIETGFDALYKSQELTIDFQTKLVTEQDENQKEVKVCKILSWVLNENGINIFGVQKVENLVDFEGKDILSELHKSYMKELKEKNPEIEFTDTYNNK
jgi:hypothetical protein